MELFNILIRKSFLPEMGQALRQCSGQAALIIILVTAVVITITVSTVGRTIVDVRSSTQTEESYQALNAAEAGLEKALLSITQDPTNYTSACPDRDNAEVLVDSDNVETQSSYWCEIEEFPDTDNSYEMGPVERGDSRTIWLISDPKDPLGSDHYLGDLTIESEFETTVPSAVMELQFVHLDDSDVPRVQRVYRENDDIKLIGIPQSILESLTDDKPLYIKIHPINIDLDKVTVSGYGNDFPSQGVHIDIRGMYLGSGEGDQAITRRLEVTRWHDEIAPLFDYVLYSGKSVVK